MNKATLKYRWWNIYEFPPEGWVIDENTGSPLCGHDFYTNGKSPLNGQKRALVMSTKLTDEQREHVKALLQEKLSQGTLLSMSGNVMDEETYLSISGASRQDIGDSAFHKNKGSHSDKSWSKMINAQAEKDRKLIAKRDELRKEYWQKVENGELREPTRNEKLIATANGNIDNECTMAARRLLIKKGIDWRKQNV